MIPLLVLGAVAAAASAASAAAQGAGAKSAADAQAQQAAEALKFQREVWQQQRADQAPWLQAGMTSLGDLAKLGQDPGSIANNPAYQFRLGEGQKALERSAAARGGLRSGRFMKGLARYSQGVASEEYGTQWNRLASIAGLGQTSAQNLGSLGAQYGNQATELYGAMGNAQAAGAVGTGNAISNALGNIGGIGLGLGSRYLPPIPTQGG